MPKIELNGREVEFKPGETILNIAWREGENVPVFCYHPKLPVFAGCRMCLVEVEFRGRRSLMPACGTAAADGMKVWTNSENTKFAQKSVLELLLLNHPLDCPNCDAGGECDLQEITFAHGPTTSRYKFPKRKYEIRDVGPFIDLYPTRCIQCYRCATFYWTIGGGKDWAVFDRGWYTLFGPARDKFLQNEFSGNLIEVCPLGAITGRDYKFFTRPWEIESTPTVSPEDSLGANVYVDVRRRKPFSRGPFVKAGRREDLHKIIRINGRENPDVNEFWITDRDRFSHEYNNINRIDYPHLRLKNGEWFKTNWNLALAWVVENLKNAKNPAIISGARGTNESAYAARKLFKEVLLSDNLDFRRPHISFKEDPLKAVLGYSASTSKVSDIDKADVIVLVGDVRETVPGIGIRLIRAARRGAKVYVVNYYKERYASEGWAEWVQVKPGSEDRDTYRFIKETLEPLKDKRVLVVLTDDWREGVQRNFASFVVLNDNAGLLVLRTLPNAQGFIDMGFTPEPDGSTTKEILEEAANGDIDALIIWEVEPLWEYPDADLVKKALENTPFVVVMSSFWDPSTDYASVILPITTPYEEEGTRTNLEGRVQYCKDALWPYEGSRPAWWIFKNIIRGLGGKADWDGAKDVFEEIKERVLVYHNINPYKVEYEELPYPDYIPTVRKLKKVFKSPKVDYNFIPADVRYFDGGEEIKERILLWAPHIYKGSYWAFRNPIQKPYIYEETVFASPEELAELGINDGARVLLRIGGKEYGFNVKGDERIPKGLWLFKGLFYDVGINGVLKGIYIGVEDVVVSTEYAVQ
ncbi:MAG: molybdopterin-dependent oxidoreductase [candidate division WOR-3 bacterium]